jgi:hypothetical protein
MTKLGRLSNLDEAASWLAEKLEDAGFTPAYLIELGVQGNLEIHAGIPIDELKLPEGIVSPGLKHTPFLDGIIEFNSLCCLRIQAQENVGMIAVDFKGFTYPLRREVKITQDMLRIKRDVLEAYVSRLNDAKMVCNEESVRSGVTKQEILNAEWPKVRGAPSMKSIVKELPQWVVPACKQIGGRGKGPYGSHKWNPAILAACLATRTPHKKWRVQKSALDLFMRDSFPDYYDEWKTCSEHIE